MQYIQMLWQKFIDFINNFSVAPTYIQAGAIIVLIFLLVISLAQFRHHFVKWSMKGGLIGLFFGILLTLLLEGFLLVSGHTALTGLLGWKNAPKPISTALDVGKEKLTNTLLDGLNPSEITKIKAIICTP